MIKILRACSSLRLTLVGMLLLAAGLVLDQNQWLPGTWSIVSPLVLLALNLAAALVFNRRFHCQPALFAFHVCLLLLVVLAAWGQLARFEGRLMLAEAQAASADQLQKVRDAFVAPPALEDGFMRQAELSVDYFPGIRRGATHSTVWSRDKGWQRIGDDVPLLIDGYRIYTTSNKGFAAVLRWEPADGQPLRGAVMFPSYPASELMQQAEWRTPGGERLKMMLAVPPSHYGRAWTLEAKHAETAELTIEVEQRVVSLAPGESTQVGGGRLLYDRVSMWMGYKITYDPTLPWLFSVAFLGVVFLAAHLYRHTQSGAPLPAVTEDGYAT